MSVTDAAIDRIRELILSGELSPGDRLPAEQELAAQLGLSRNSLREAISALTRARVLDVRRGDGTYVTSLQADLLLDGLRFAIDLLHDSTLLEVFEVRRLLEPAATGLAATRATDEELVVLRKSLQAMRDAEDVEEFISLDFEFHARVAEASGNQTLCGIMSALSSRAMRARLWRVASQGLRSFTLEQHARIVDAIGRRDPALASAASTIHVAASEDWLRQVLAEGGGWRDASPTPAGER